MVPRSIPSLVVLFIVLLKTFSGAWANSEIPDIFEYRFPDADPIRIYSGTVRFAHKAHIVDYRISCLRCHHYLKDPGTRISDSCRKCHTREGFPRFAEARALSSEERKQHYLVALHDQCISCHLDVRLINQQSSIPISCTRCHVRN